MVSLDWKLRHFLEQHNISTLALSKAMGSKRVATLYRLTSPKKPPTRVDLSTLEAVIAALRTLTGKAINVTDLLEVNEVSTRVLHAKQPDPAVTNVIHAKNPFRPKYPKIRPQSELSSTQVLRQLRDQS